MSLGKLEDAKKVATHNLEGQENGGLIELYKDGEKTLAYMTMIKPGMFKGYHLHRIRKARYFCLKGAVKIILYKDRQKEEYILSAEKPQRLFIPDNIATGLSNIGSEDVWLINFPDPPYDPNLKDEQVEYTEEELKNGVVK
ncbi:MAG: WxcM-like domain-containing protein [Patescibacteria group bacterium]|nr:WxcM-like domain-containing protein [Patescibacteria group bacterium]